ncbi:MAG: sensor histidine kinase [Micromonosporaceae bacterium]
MRLQPASPAPDHAPVHPLSGRITDLGQRLRRADRDHVWALDAAVAVLVLLLFCVPDLLRAFATGPSDLSYGLRLPSWPATLALQAAVVAPLVWRRRRPLAAFSVIMAAVLLQRLLHLDLMLADFAPPIAVYSLARYGRLKHLPWACAAVVAGSATVAMRTGAAEGFAPTLLIAVGLVTAPAAAGLVVRFRQAELATLRERAARLEIERDQRSRLAIAAERARVAREMHDIVGHHLSVIVTLADGGAYAVGLAPERGKEALQLIGDTGRQALDELRRTLSVLRDHTDERANGAELNPQPGIADIDGLCAHIRAAGPEVVYRTTGDLQSLDRGVQLAVYRIVQEALTNALRHAGPHTRVHLTLIREGAQMRVSVEDTGPPADTGRPEPAHVGHGLTGVRERAALYGGTVLAGTRPEKGWVVRATLDLTPVPLGGAS